MATNPSTEGDDRDFSGDQCVILPANYLESAVAVSEIHADELAIVAGNLEIDHWSKRGFFRGTAIAALLWAIPAVWTVCL